jgi:hypothetical protein
MLHRQREVAAMTPEELNEALVELIARHRSLLEELARADTDPPEPDNQPATDPSDPEPTPRKAA